MAQLIAKPDGTTLIEHLCAVLAFGAQLADKLGLAEPLRSKALLACALHDIGKATLSFQDYASGSGHQSFPHALASFPFTLFFEKQLNAARSCGQSHYLATAAVLSHHSPLSHNLYRSYADLPSPSFHEDLPRTLEYISEALANQGVTVPISREAFTEAMKVLLKESPAAFLDHPMTIEGKNSSLRGILQRLPSQDFAAVKCILHLADWLVSAGKENVSSLFLDHGASLTKQHIDKLSSPLRAFQQEAIKHSTDSLLWLRAPTGSGKTEALLLWANNAQRLVYLLPTQATTNAMWRRLTHIYGQENVGLAHGRASYFLQQQYEEELLDHRLFGSVFAKPITVATLDQYLLAHLNARHWEERRALARHATIILDEIHAYEPYTLGMLCEALRREPPHRLALASATLPASLLSLFPQGHLIEAEPPLWEKRRHRLHSIQRSLLEEGPQLACKLASEGQTVLIVVNTVRDAQEVFKILRDREKVPNLTLLHSRFCLRDRALKEETITRPTPGAIVVATQVVEVSLDISYDVLLTELAPLDALVQRLGRVNRYGNSQPARVFLYQTISSGSLRIYGKDVLDWSNELLQRLPTLPSDGELCRVVAELYDRILKSPSWKAELDEGAKTLDEIQKTLGCHTIDLGDEDLRNRFTARRGTLSIEVLPSQFVEEAYHLKETQEAWRLPELLVPVPIFWLRTAPDQFRFCSDLNLVVASLPYSLDVGLALPDGEPSLLTGVFLE